MVRRSREIDRPRQEWLWRRRWRRSAARRTLTVVGVLTVLAVAAKVAVDHYGWPVAVGINSAVIAVLAGVGRAAHPPATKEDKPPEDKPGEPPAPFPLADARTRAEAADAVTRALNAEGIELRLCEEPARTQWGWTIPVVLRQGTPALVVGKAGNLETHLDLPAGGVLPTPDLSRRARVVLRLAERDPFDHLPAAPARPPLSASITDHAVIGWRIDGRPLSLPLLGVHGIIVGDPDSGKTTTLLTLADFITACHDAVVWDLTPAGDGLRILGDAVGRRERQHDRIEDALAFAVALAEVRPRLGPELGMDTDEWDPSPQRPALAIFVDEYPRLSARAKKLATTLVDIGRKPRVTLFLATTHATTDALGAAMASTTGLKIMHPSRFDDIRLVFGPGRSAEGWRPDRLHPATADIPGQAGQCYVFTGGYHEPLLSKITPINRTDARKQAQERAAVGIPHIDAESHNAARAWLATNDININQDGNGDGERLSVDVHRITDMITVCGADRKVRTEDLLSRLATLDQRYAEMTAEDLAALLRPLRVRPVQIWRDGRNRNGYDRDEIITALQKWRQQHA
jgi:S-DNA-T family DNA segregation ATPase FtsK/SpoIIIE